MNPKKKKNKLTILYEDKNVIVVDKPAHLLTIATEKESHTLYQEVRAYVKKQNPKYKIFIVHRLDKDTSGAVLFAKNEEYKKLLQEHWDELAIERKYLAIVEGTSLPNEKTITSYLDETKTLYVYETKNKKKGKLAITKWKKREEKNKKTLLEIEIKTGRKNQIRVQLASLGYPIVGDKKYGAKTNPYRRMLLHAYQLTWIDPKTKEEHTAQAKIPSIFDL